MVTAELCGEVAIWKPNRRSSDLVTEGEMSLFEHDLHMNEDDMQYD
jgi:hypothetical protein